MMNRVLIIILLLINLAINAQIGLIVIDDNTAYGNQIGIRSSFSFEQVLRIIINNQIACFDDTVCLYIQNSFLYDSVETITRFDDYSTASGEWIDQYTESPKFIPSLATQDSLYVNFTVYGYKCINQVCLLGQIFSTDSATISVELRQCIAKEDEINCDTEINCNTYISFNNNIDDYFKHEEILYT